MRSRGRKALMRNFMPVCGRPLHNTKRGPFRPGRIDPTRSFALRKAFKQQIRKQFSALKVRVLKLVLEQDAFGLKRKPLGNAFCPTGAGGGIDPTCSSGSSTLSSGQHVRFVKPANASKDEVMVMVSAKKLDEAWSKDTGYYLPTGAKGESEVSGRRERFEEFLTTGKAIETPRLSLTYGTSFTNGRHRFAVLRDKGIDKVGVLIDKSELHLVKELVDNAFCPTGSGGGVDPSCSSSEGAPPVGREVLQRDASQRPLIAFLNKYNVEMLPVHIGTGSRPTAPASRTHEDVKISSLSPTEVGAWAEVVGKEKAAAISKSVSEGKRLLPILAESGSVLDGHHRVAGTLQAGKDTIGISHSLRSLVGIWKRANGSTKPTKDLVAKYENHLRRMTRNEDWRDRNKNEMIKAFQKWLREQLGALVLGKSNKELWEIYVKEGFKKGAGRAFDDVKKPLVGLDPDEDARAKKLSFYNGSRQQFLKSAFGQPESVAKVKLLAGRSFDDLEGITRDMSLRMSRKLTDGLVEGKNPRDIARDLAEEVDIGRGRAELIARTEIIRAHAEGQLEAMEALGVEEVGVSVEWTTAGDERVCDLCLPLEGVILKIDEARNMIPRHPNCRCAWVPAGVGEDDKNQKDTKGAIIKAIEVSIKRGGREEDEEWGPNKRISKDRPESILKK